MIEEVIEQKSYMKEELELTLKVLQLRGDPAQLLYHVGLDYSEQVHYAILGIKKLRGDIVDGYYLEKYGGDIGWD